MPKLSLWRGVAVRSNDYKLLDRVIAEKYTIGGTEFYIHKLLGIDGQDVTDANTVNLDETGNDDPLLTIEDPLNLENRDRSYDPDVYSLLGHYQVTDMEFSMGQFGFFDSADTIFITFHLNNMVDRLSRKLINGDVIEVLHKRDDLVLGQDVAVNKYYVVNDAVRPAEGYSYTWWPHLWRVKCNVITDSQEFQDILGAPVLDASGDPVPNGQGGDTTLQDVLSTQSAVLAITDAIIAEATTDVPFRYFQAQHFYIIPGQETNIIGPNTFGPNPGIWVGDGIPPNGSNPVPNGTNWPTTPLIGDYFLRTDFNPPQLYQRVSNVWKRIQTDWRNPWQPGNQKLISFINNTNTTKLDDRSTINQQQNIQDVVKPRLDPDII